MRSNHSRFEACWMYEKASHNSSRGRGISFCNFPFVRLSSVQSEYMSCAWWPWKGATWKQGRSLASCQFICSTTQPATPGPTIDKGFVPSSLAESQLGLHFIAPTSKKKFSALLKQSLHKGCFFGANGWFVNGTFYWDLCSTFPWI